ncbi:hypothetical protein SAMN04489712_106304 [Thermomonospora echinospora]|uniref:Uncharacterized protein n=1 Tax=Thermomonospora echinospora TaxID=1992 RepID=A0A1H6B651_9ACTN|nr:hypothetical protein [Thermomonospora echinospora]SEG56331.1 hypothetical protein SAMN04489712_106304 [Thermomonospora echinospora]
MTITVDHVRQLFASDEPGATLVIVAGRPQITSNPAEDDGLVVAGREDLMRGRDTPPGEDELNRLAETLNATVSELGG